MQLPIDFFDCCTLATNDELMIFFSKDHEVVYHHQLTALSDYSELHLRDYFITLCRICTSSRLINRFLDRHFTQQNELFCCSQYQNKTSAPPTYMNAFHTSNRCSSFKLFCTFKTFNFILQYFTSVPFEFDLTILGFILNFGSRSFLILYRKSVEQAKHLNFRTNRLLLFTVLF